MPYRYAIEPAYGVAFVQVTGYTDAELLDQAADAVLADAHWRTGFSTVWDLRGASLDITPDGFSALVARKLEREQDSDLRGKIAIILNRDVMLSLAHLAKLLASTPARELGVFPDEYQACAWLGLPDGFAIRYEPS